MISDFAGPVRKKHHTFSDHDLRRIRTYNWNYLLPLPLSYQTLVKSLPLLYSEYPSWAQDKKGDTASTCLLYSIVRSNFTQPQSHFIKFVSIITALCCSLHFIGSTSPFKFHYFVLPILTLTSNFLTIIHFPYLIHHLTVFHCTIS